MTIQSYFIFLIIEMSHDDQNSHIYFAKYIYIIYLQGVDSVLSPQSVLSSEKFRTRNSIITSSSNVGLTLFVFFRNLLFVMAYM